MASKRRISANPDYPQLLKFMGYEFFISRKIN